MRDPNYGKSFTEALFEKVLRKKKKQKLINKKKESAKKY